MGYYIVEESVYRRLKRVFLVVFVSQLATDTVVKVSESG